MSFERNIQMENHIILPVFGQFDANIKKIEKACGVSIVNRGDDVKISGEEKDVHKAWNILHSLVALVKKGEEITEQNLEYFISSAEAVSYTHLFIGSWNTRPRYFALLCSGSFVISSPSMITEPLSTGQTPAMAFSMVDFLSLIHIW